jgi:SAM-dependent MidA family methyltransferase
MKPGENLLSHLARRIRREGPLTFADFMAEALYHPALGRYSQASPPMSPEGDYITSPEVDPAFGRLLARALAGMAERATPGPFTIVEMGPGRGTLARDLLLSMAEESEDLSRRTRCVLVERSEALRREQRSRLEGAGLLDRVSWISWHDLLRSGPIAGCILANEFLDALPVHLVEVTEGRLREIHVGIGADGSLREIPGEPSSDRIARYFEEAGARLAEGQRAEVNLGALRWISEAASLLRLGYAVVVDYGHEASELFSERHFAGTLVGYRRHQLVVDPLADPGAHDLTSHVDFTSLAREGLRAGFSEWALTSQRKLLTAMGLAEMIADLSRPGTATSEGERLKRRFALHALMSPSGMGETFKVMILAKGAPLVGLRCLDDRFTGRRAEIHGAGW